MGIHTPTDSIPNKFTYISTTEFYKLVVTKYT